MTYQDFKENVTSAIQEKLGPSVKVTIQEIIKNNDTHLDGLTILSNQLNISPTIYLNYYFKQYLNGKPMDDIYRDILSLYEENKPSGNIDISFFTDYEQVKTHIVFKLINYERNKVLLEKVPHMKFLDLAIIFNCLVEADEKGSATILIYNQHLAFWNITKEDLYVLAMKNTPALLAYDLRDMSDVLMELMKGSTCSSTGSDSTELNPVAFDFEENDFENAIPMYVLSNKHKLNGSCCILYQDLLHSFSTKLDCDLYILPSSVHEVLLIPAYRSDSFEELSAIVREVNATQLSREEVLSDHVYFYSRETGQITM